MAVFGYIAYRGYVFCRPGAICGRFVEQITAANNHG